MRVQPIINNTSMRTSPSANNNQASKMNNQPSFGVKWRNMINLKRIRNQKLQRFMEEVLRIMEEEYLATFSKTTDVLVDFVEGKDHGKINITQPAKLSVGSITNILPVDIRPKKIHKGASAETPKSMAERFITSLKETVTNYGGPKEFAQKPIMRNGEWVLPMDIEPVMLLPRPGANLAASA